MFKSAKNRKWIVYVATFPPRECGIATFTQDLTNSFDEMYEPREESKIIAMNPGETSRYIYDRKKVIYQIPQSDEQSYTDAANYVNNLEQVSLVHVQHEFGIFGGPNGSHIVLFLRALKKPAVITFHTVLPAPDVQFGELVGAINNHVQKIIVMTEDSKKILINEYAISPEKISVISHGIHPVDFSDGEKARKELSLSGRTVISTFGLIGRGKGIEHGIRAMVEVVKKNPKATYLIIGATHPNILKEEGEAYRNSLIEIVHDLKLQNNIFFYDKYLELNELLRFLSASNIYLSLSQNPNQAVSGTLSYALGTGRPVVSTAFSQAKEDVTNDVGILVDFNDYKGVEQALIRLVNDKTLRDSMGKEAYFKTRSRTWKNVTLLHMNEYIRLVPSLGEEEKNLPAIKLSHISEMTDSFGMFQFANLLTPDPSSGYTLDDNARALIALTKYYELFKTPKSIGLIKIYLDFIENLQSDGGGFSNYVDVHKKIIPDQHTRENLESASTKGMHAVAICATSEALPTAIREKACAIFRKNIHTLGTVTSPRSISFALKSFCIWNAKHPSDEIKDLIVKLSDQLLELFKINSAPDWKWFEDILAYSNGILPESLIDAYQSTNNEKYLTVAQQALDFLIQNSFEGSMCVPIGQKGWLRFGQKKYLHDQQPEEVAYLVSCLKAMYKVTGDERYAKLMRIAFDWFLGNNILNRIIYDQSSGGCYDGLGEKEVNLNQGAESTVMYLLARLQLE